MNPLSYDDLLLEVEQLRARDREWRSCCAIVAHEIGTPLQAILAALDLVESSPAQDIAARDRALQRIRNALELLSAQFSDLARFAKVPIVVMPIRAKPFQVSGIAEHIAIAYKPKATAKGLTLTVEGSPATAPWLVGDAGRVTQVVGNLVDNAIKYTTQGCVSVSMAMEVDDLVIKVEDTGIGIDPADLPTISEAFRRGRNVPAGAAGVGLGLMIVQELVNAMDGRLSFDRVSPHGMRVSVRLPLKALSENDSKELAP
jgi:two-component system sensor histidine kinase TorS